MPALSGSSVSYNRGSNMLQTQGYTSAAGNTYYQGILVSDRIVVNYNLSQGYLYLFLNGIRVYGYNGREKRLIGSRSYYCCCFNKQYAMRETIGIICDYMKSQIRQMNAHCDDEQVLQFATRLVEETNSKMKQLSQY